ncbi:hypothetical protein BVX97_05895 [bacterium E08(2017)]|nr:hypothetical protein BVX97_05895 [bacterium E08(2017)]
MRYIVTSTILFALLVSPIIAEDKVELGDSKSRVRELLGKPRGIMKKGKSEYWSYQRGIVRITDGKVSYTNLYSEEEARQKEARRRAMIRSRAEAERKAAQERKAKIAEGNTLKDEKLNNAEFRSLPAEEQIASWKEFAEEYPKTDVSDVITALENGEMLPLEAEPEKEKTESELLSEELKAKEDELEALIQKAKTTSAGRTFRLQYLQDRKRLEGEIGELQMKIKEVEASASSTP